MFDDITSRSLVATLDVRSARHGHLAHNVANVDTPGYRPSDIDFDASLRAILADTPDAAGTPTDRAELMVEQAGPESSPDADGNTVDLDRTLAALSENGIHYASAARFTGKRLAMLRYVVSDGLG